MSNGGEIFSNELPGIKKAMASYAKQQSKAKPAEVVAVKSKRQYTKRGGGVNPATSPVPDAIDKAAPPLRPVLVERFGSFGLEYIQALARLLELLSPVARDRLVQFIIDAKIV